MIRANIQSNYFSFFFIFISSVSFIEKCNIDQPEVRGIGFNDLETIEGNIECPYGSPDCAPCIYDVLGQLSNLSTNENDSAPFNFKNRDLNINFSLRKHAQGVARIPGNGSESWMAITRHHGSKKTQNGVVLVHYPNIPSSGSSLQLTEKKGSNAGSIVKFLSTDDNKHPGGCQIIGNTLLVAHEAGDEDLPAQTWISFYDVSDPITSYESRRFYFDGTDDLGNSYPLTDRGQANNIGMVQLKDGRYLMLAMESRRRLKYDVALFFISSNDQLKNTKWEYRQVWHQLDLVSNPMDWRVYENINLVTDCTDGQIYLLGFHGNGQNNAIDIYNLFLDSNQLIRFKKVMEKEVITRNGGATFRAGASVHITPDNQPVIYGVEKSERGDWMMVEEFAEQISKD